MRAPAATETSTSSRPTATRASSQRGTTSRVAGDDTTSVIRPPPRPHGRRWRNGSPPSHPSPASDDALWTAEREGPPRDARLLRVTGPRFLQLADVAEIPNISAAQTYALVRSGELPAIKIGGRGQWRGEGKGAGGPTHPGPPTTRGGGR